MFGFVKKMFIGLLTTCIIGSFGEPLIFHSKGHIKCVSINNWPYKLFSTKPNQPLYYPFIVSVNKCVGCFNTIDDPYGRVCVPWKIKKLNIKVFNIISGLDETRSLVQYESCEFKCGPNESVCY